MRSRRVASQQVTPEHAPDFNYNRSFSYKRPADEAVCRSRGRHVECTAYWEGCVPLEWKLGGGTSWSQGILFSTPIVSLVPSHPFHFTALWPSLAPFSRALAAENNGGQKASGSTRQALQNAVCQWNSSMQTDCGVARQRFQIQHSEAEINFYVVQFCTKHKWCVNQLCSTKRQRLTR